MKPALSAAAALVLSATLAAQTAIKPPKNKYKPEDDVKLGREAAAEVRKQMPVIENGQINDYLARIGRELVAQAPPELSHPEFEYSFTAVNLKDINAFALPGGPMFVNRGMVDAATTEGQVAGVMAHELSHVLLRHGTANATKAQNAQLGALAGAIAGAVIGGRVGTAVSQGSQFGLGTWLLKYSREYEKQADLLGAQLMARAGYDPNDLARMFETIEKQAKGGGPEWLSDHPNPGNRSQYIAQEARSLQVAPNPRNGSDFQEVKQAFAQQPPARSMGELAGRTGSGGGNGSDGTMASTGTPGQPVPPPSSRSRVERGGIRLPGQRPRQLAHAVGEQLHPLRAGERLRSDERPERADARRRARRGAGRVDRPDERHGHLRPGADAGRADGAAQRRGRGS